MKHEKFVKFIEDISVDGNEYLGESILEAYGLCFFDVSLRNEANKILEAVGDTKKGVLRTEKEVEDHFNNGGADEDINKMLQRLMSKNSKNKVLQEGVLETMRTWPRQKIMALVLGALITMTASSGMAANSPQVIDGARESVIEQLGGDGNDGDDEAVDKMVKGAVKKYGDKIEEKAAKEDGDSQDASFNEYAKKFIEKHLEKGSTPEDLSNMMNKIIMDDKETNSGMKTLAKEVIKQLQQGDDSGSNIAKELNERKSKLGGSRSGDAFNELHENDKLRSAGMSPRDICEYRLAALSSTKKLKSGSYDYRGVTISLDDLSDKEHLNEITQKANKILSKS